MREVWFWKEDVVTVHALEGEAYVVRDRSTFIPNWDLSIIAKLLDEPTAVQAVRALRVMLGSSLRFDPPQCVGAGGAFRVIFNARNELSRSSDQRARAQRAVSQWTRHERSTPRTVSSYVHPATAALWLLPLLCSRTTVPTGFET